MKKPLISLYFQWIPQYPHRCPRGSPLFSTFFLDGPLSWHQWYQMKVGFVRFGVKRNPKIIDYNCHDKNIKQSKPAVKLSTLRRFGKRFLQILRIYHYMCFCFQLKVPTSVHDNAAHKIRRQHGDLEASPRHWGMACDIGQGGTFPICLLWKYGVLCLQTPLQLT